MMLLAASHSCRTYRAKEEDFSTIQEARDWLIERGGGRIERYAERGRWLYSSETISPRQLAETAHRR